MAQCRRGGVLLRRQPQPGDDVAALVGLAVAVGVAENRQEGGVHHVDRAAVILQPLDRVEPGRVHRGAVRVAVAVGVLGQADLIAANDLDTEPGHVVDGDEDRRRPRPQGDGRGILDERIAGEQGRLKAGRDFEWREALLRGGAGDGRRLTGRCERGRKKSNDDHGTGAERSHGEILAAPGAAGNSQAGQVHRFHRLLRLKTARQEDDVAA